MRKSSRMERRGVRSSRLFNVRRRRSTNKGGGCGAMLVGYGIYGSSLWAGVLFLFAGIVIFIQLRLHTTDDSSFKNGPKVWQEDVVRAAPNLDPRLWVDGAPAPGLGPIGEQDGEEDTRKQPRGVEPPMRLPSWGEKPGDGSAGTAGEEDGSSEKPLEGEGLGQAASGAAGGGGGATNDADSSAGEEAVDVEVQGHDERDSVVIVPARPAGPPATAGSGGGGYRDPADGAVISYEVGSQGAGPIERFLAEGKKLPIILLTCDRDVLLRETIQSLRDVRGMDMSSVMVLQDGSDKQVAATVRAEGLYLQQNTGTPSLRGGPKPGDGAKRIAMHYKFSLDHVFKTAPEAPAVIIVEDDLLFSPDFLEFLEANAPVLERDPTTMVLSAWNDNGYRGRVSDKAELQRTLYFPGLGWLLSRHLYEEIRPRWPREHWDHWLRDPKQHRGRECVFPEVPRTYHNGIKGTFMDQAMHDKLFKNIDYNTDASFSWGPPDGRTSEGPPPYALGIQDNYERRVYARIREARHINNVDDLSASFEGQQEEVVFWYWLQETEEQPVPPGRQSKGSPFKPLSNFFGIWHEYKRGEHNGMHVLRYEGKKHVMLINEAKSQYAKLKPEGIISASMATLHGSGVERGSGRGGGGGGVAEGKALQIVAGERSSLSCDDICSAKGMACKQSTFELLNSCTLLTKNFPCTACSESYGADQPCYVELRAPEKNFPGQCLTSSDPTESRCSASHELTRRLCPCTSPGR